MQDALFHCLATSNANMLVGCPSAHRSQPAWRQAYRALQHGTARQRCERQGMIIKFPYEIQDFAERFVDMQQKRHEADYDPDATFSKSDVIQDITDAEDVIRCFNIEHIRLPQYATAPAFEILPTNRSRAVLFVRTMSAQDKARDRALCSGDRSVKWPHRAMPCAQKSKSDVVVAVAGRVVVAIRRPHVLGVVVEVAAPENAVRAYIGLHPIIDE